MTSLVIDLSRAISAEFQCSCIATDGLPVVSYEQPGRGLPWVTSRIDGLRSDIGTHVTFPGHLAGGTNSLPVGCYSIDRFVGPAAVLDVSYKLKAFEAFFDAGGGLLADDRWNVVDFVHAIDSLAVTADDLDAGLARISTDPRDLKGLLLHSGVAAYWVCSHVPVWPHRYFFSPFLSDDGCRRLCGWGLSFVGIDACQLEHPIVNFSGDEPVFATHPSARAEVRSRLGHISQRTNHHQLLGADVLIYEGLVIPSWLADSLIDFAGVPLNLQISGLNDNALVRAYARSIPVAQAAPLSRQGKDL